MADTMIETEVGADGLGVSILMRLAWGCGTLFTGVVALVMGVLYVKQESLLYFPAIGGLPRRTSQNPRRYRSPSEHNIPFETHMIPCADGTSIHSWLLYHPENGDNGSPSSSNRKVPTIVFFHGNAGNIGMRLPNAVQMYHYLKANVWLVEYRGFGDSDDAPVNEAGLKMDAEAAWDYAHGGGGGENGDRIMRNVDPRRLFVFGRSLGGAVAFHLAQYSQSGGARRFPPLAGVIVENTFLSISEMVDHLMPLVAPFKALVLRMSWNSGRIAPTLRIPTLFLAGGKDELVPHSHMTELFDRMTSASDAGRKNLVRMHVVKDGTHNETWMQGGKGYWAAIQKFMSEVFEDEWGGAGAGRGDAKDRHGAGVFQRTRSASTAASSSRTATTSASSSSGEAVEVTMGCEGEDAADMISSVGTFMGMAREAVTGGGVAGAYKKKD